MGEWLSRALVRDASENPQKPDEGKNTMKHLPDQQCGKPLHESQCKVCMLTNSLEIILSNSMRAMKPVPRKRTPCTGKLLFKLILWTQDQCQHHSYSPDLL